jgi:hypothetical protein
LQVSDVGVQVLQETQEPLLDEHCCEEEQEIVVGGQDALGQVRLLPVQ